MKLAFREITPGGIPRPIVDVVVQGIDEVPLPCMIDTGSLNNRFAAWVARSAGIDLAGLPVETAGIGGRMIQMRTATIALRIGRLVWEAPVSFCEPWPWDVHLLGQEGFLRHVAITFDAAQRSMSIRSRRADAAAFAVRNGL